MNATAVVLADAGADAARGLGTWFATVLLVVVVLLVAGAGLAAWSLWRSRP